MMNGRLLLFMSRRETDWTNKRCCCFLLFTYKIWSSPLSILSILSSWSMLSSWWTTILSRQARILLQVTTVCWWEKEGLVCALIDQLQVHNWYWTIQFESPRFLSPVLPWQLVTQDWYYIWSLPPVKKISFSQQLSFSYEILFPLQHNLSRLRCALPAKNYLVQKINEMTRVPIFWLDFMASIIL